MAVEVGQRAPEFTLKDTDRNDRSLSEFLGKNVVLAFMPGAFTGVCTAECVHFRDNGAAYANLNAQVIGITVDSPFAQKGWADANQITFPLLSDWPQNEVAKAYDVWWPESSIAHRVTYVIDKEGIVRGVIESETDMEVHSRDALRIVKELAGKQ